MTATFVPGPWSATAVAARTAWRFGRRLEGPLGMQWVMKRNCSISPRGLTAFYLTLCTVSLAIAAAFWFAGARSVLAFAGLELLALGAALLVYARHAADCETITLAGRELAIEHRCGVDVEHARFRAEWVRVEPVRSDGSLIEVSGEGRRTCVGRYLRPEWRGQLAHELRLALRLRD
ncbi:MAG: DUF2244 domain-containing protein [Burkholderiaceae bacterium]|nr:DUF2244 domain-containing protein [Ideonella sp.]MCC7287548.1 DUF2244 domain-containing protein [Burkholderiaceae bacterium]